MNIKILVMALAFSVPLSAAAQKNKVKNKVRKANVVEASPGLQLYKSMIHSTAKLMFVDSIVVDKNTFLSQIPLGKESGALAMRDQQHSQYVNEFGDRCFYADGDTLSSTLYSKDKLGGKWTKPSPVLKTATDIDYANFPFLMSDGVTLYFGAKGANTMGGYDIFVTTFDHDSGVFYAPENIGLPYNSTANDYMLAIDDIHKIGWLVTDRRQPEGKVCIYTFEPTEARQGFENDNLSDKELERYARILSISDTWKFGNRKAAMARVGKLKTSPGNALGKNESESKEVFVVNDNITYTDQSQFRSGRAREMYLQLLEMRQTYRENRDKLDETRMEYHDARNKASLSYKIKTMENSQEKLYADIKAMEKNIRKVELNNH